MNKIIFMCPAMLLLCFTAAKAETIRTYTADEYCSVIHSFGSECQSNPYSLSLTEEDTHVILLAHCSGELDSRGAEHDVWDEYNIHTLIYNNTEAAEAAYEYYTENDIPVCTNDELYLFDDDVSDAESNYLSWGPEYIGADMFNTGLINKYGSVNNMPSITVAVLDSGIDYTHPLLSSRVDYESGYDYCNNDPDAMDDQYHGTHVAGIIADTTFENVTLIPIKVSNKYGKIQLTAFKSGLAKAIELDVDIVNMSIGGSDPEKSLQVLNELFDNAHEKGIVMCVSAGNAVDGVQQDADYIFPAYMDNVIVAANCTKYGTISSTSNYGDVIDLAAPGADIMSTYPGNTIQSLSGTSMACPFVSSAAAMLKTYYPDITPDDVEAMLKDNTRPISGSYNKNYGNGILNLFFSPDMTAELSYSILRINITDNFGALSRGGSLYVIGYNSAGGITVLDTITATASLSSGLYVESPESYKQIKIFLWNSSNSMIPLCSEYTLTLTDEYD